MKDVARVAQVSPQTVSRVVNDHPSVKPATRQKVLDAIRQLGYRPNAVARSLKSRRTRTLGVISVDTTLYGPASTLYGIEQAARQHGYFVTVVVLPTLDPEAVFAAGDWLQGIAAVDGLIILAPHANIIGALRRLPSDVPVVLVGCVAHAERSSVAVDNEGAAYRVTAALLDLGHRTVHHVAGPRDWLDAHEREVGWRRALEERGAPVPPPAVAADWSVRSGFDLGRRLAANTEISAVFCANDHIALGFMRALQAAGLHIPADVSVVGFDDIPEAVYFAPPLTTVRQDFGEVGRRALSRLVEVIDQQDRGPRPPAARGAQHVMIAADVMLRASSGPPRDGGT